MNWFLKCLSNYATFSGRARRKEYWMYILFYAIFGFVAGFIDGIIMAALRTDITIVTWLYVLAMIIPTWAVSIRRLHDTDRSGWFMLLSFVPIVGSIVLLVFTCTDGTLGANKYGPDPKGRSNGGYGGYGNPYGANNPYGGNNYYEINGNRDREGEML